MALIDILLRTTSHPDLAAKGAELSFTEGDSNLIIIYENLKALNAGTGIVPYNAGDTYTGLFYVSHAGNIWKHVSATPSLGVTPGTNPLVWELSSVGALAHQQNTDTTLGGGSPFAINAIQLRGLYDNSLISGTYAAVSGTVALAALRPGYWYYSTDKFVALKALSTDKFDEVNGIMLARNCDYQNTSGNMLQVGTGVNKTVEWGATGSQWWTAVLVAFPSSGSRLNKIAVYNNFHYRNITGNNGATTPNLDTTNWTLLGKTDASYVIEVEKCSVDFADSCRILYRECSRGNKIRKPAGYEIENIFPFGNDKVTNNIAEGRLSVLQNWGFVVGNYISYSSELVIDGNGNTATFTSAVSLNHLEHAAAAITNNTGSLLANQIDDGAFVIGGNSGTISYSYFHKNTSSPVMTNNQGTINQSIFERCGGLTIGLTSGGASISRTTIKNSALSLPVLNLAGANDDKFIIPGYPLPSESGSVIIASNQIAILDMRIVEVDGATGGGIVFTVDTVFNGHFVKIVAKAGTSFYVDTTIGNIKEIAGLGLVDWTIDSGASDYMTGFYMDGSFYVSMIQHS